MERKDRQSPNKNCKVRWRTQDEDMREITTKTDTGSNFEYTKDRQRKSLRYTAKIGLWQIFLLSISVLSREKCRYQSH